MTFTRSQTESMSRDELVEEFLKLMDVSSKLSDPVEKFDDFVLTLNGRGWGQFDASYGFSKIVSSKRKVKLCFFVTFNIILKHILFENFIEFPLKTLSCSENMKKVSVNISHFHLFSSIVWIF